MRAKNVIEDALSFDDLPNGMRGIYVRHVLLAELYISEKALLPLVKKFSIKARTGKNLDVLHLECSVR